MKGWNRDTPEEKTMIPEDRRQAQARARRKPPIAEQVLVLALGMAALLVILLA